MRQLKIQSNEYCRVVCSELSPFCRGFRKIAEWVIPRRGEKPACISGRASSTLGTDFLRLDRPADELPTEDSHSSNLLIVTTVLPLIIGALSVGLISVFSLQSGVASRLANTTDAQVVAANYQSDIQGTADITTASSSTPQCDAPSGAIGTQLLGLESDVGATDQSVISYVSVPVVSRLNDDVRSRADRLHGRQRA
jgi:hypothetical protein